VPYSASSVLFPSVEAAWRAAGRYGEEVLLQIRPASARTEVSNNSMAEGSRTTLAPICYVPNTRHSKNTKAFSENEERLEE